MDRPSLEALFAALNEESARYLVVGGLAVLAHGYVRTTLDVDLVLDLEPPHPEPAMRAFRRLDFRPLVPVALEQFADPQARASWIRDKNARVFQLLSDRHPTVRVDLFLEEPFEFRAAHERCHRAIIGSGIEVAFVGLEDLLEMKRRAGRPQDVADIDRLLRIRKSEHGS